MQNITNWLSKILPFWNQNKKYLHSLVLILVIWVFTYGNISNYIVVECNDSLKLFLNNQVILTMLEYTSLENTLINKLFIILLIFFFIILIILSAIKPIFALIFLFAVSSICIGAFVKYTFGSNVLMNKGGIKLIKKISEEEKIKVFEEIRNMISIEYPRASDVNWAQIKNVVADIHNKTELDVMISQKILNLISIKQAPVAPSVIETVVVFIGNHFLTIVFVIGTITLCIAAHNWMSNVTLHDAASKTNDNVKSLNDNVKDLTTITNAQAEEIKCIKEVLKATADSNLATNNIVAGLSEEVLTTNVTVKAMIDIFQQNGWLERPNLCGIKTIHLTDLHNMPLSVLKNLGDVKEVKE